MRVFIFVFCCFFAGGGGGGSGTFHDSMTHNKALLIRRIVSKEYKLCSVQ